MVALAKLSQQGELLSLLEQEKGDLPWRALIRKAPLGLLSFASRAITNTLATPTNLARWNKVVDPLCHLCKRVQANLFHILAGCQVALNQQRFTTRHNMVLEYMVEVSKQNVDPNTKVFADLDGHRANGGTIPHKYSLTAQSPDLVLVNESKNSITLIELTVPFNNENGAANAEERKT